MRFRGFRSGRMAVLRARLRRTRRNHTHLYLGAANGCIYQSQDGGKKWARLARVGNRDDLVIDNILVDPANPKHLVVGAYVVADGGDVYVSNDGGTTWTGQPEMQGQSVRSLTSAPSDPKVLVAGTLEGVFRSTDTRGSLGADQSQGQRGDSRGRVAGDRSGRSRT